MVCATVPISVHATRDMQDFNAICPSVMGNWATKPMFAPDLANALHRSIATVSGAIMGMTVTFLSVMDTWAMILKYAPRMDTVLSLHFVNVLMATQVSGASTIFVRDCGAMTHSTFVTVMEPVMLLSYVIALLDTLDQLVNSTFASHVCPMRVMCVRHMENVCCRTNALALKDTMDQSVRLLIALGISPIHLLCVARMACVNSVIHAIVLEDILVRLAQIIHALVWASTRNLCAPKEEIAWATIFAIAPGRIHWETTVKSVNWVGMGHFVIFILMWSLSSHLRYKWSELVIIYIWMEVPPTPRITPSSRITCGPVEIARSTPQYRISLTRRNTPTLPFHLKC